ncbi:hypothetical protein ACP275_13G202400 [Erythranthe tilingii]
MAESSSKEQRWLPKRIILLRHGETMENKDGVLPDHSIQLTKKGTDQAKEAGVLIKGLLDENCSSSCKWKVYIYVSPYESTRSTLREMGRAFPESKIAGVREECRLREQDLGNFHDTHKIKQLNEMRNKFGRFFYRFPDGESGADVYDRVSNFLESLWRDIEMKRCIPNNNNDGGSAALSQELNLVIVSHGLAIRIFMMRWFRWSVDQFERLNNPDNCEFIVMQLGFGGEYSLSINHNDHKLREWGLSPEMIADQRLRAFGSDQKQQDQFLWYDAFFSHSEQQDQDQDEDQKTTK